MNELSVRWGEPSQIAAPLVVSANSQREKNRGPPTLVLVDPELVSEPIAITDSFKSVRFSRPFHGLEKQTPMNRDWASVVRPFRGLQTDFCAKAQRRK